MREDRVVRSTIAGRNLIAALFLITVWAVEPVGARQEAEEKSADDAPEAHQNTVKWATASEVDNFGYDVYRSLNEEGPFERINAEVVEGAGTSDEPTHYRYVDEAIDPRKTYYYYVESISMSGVRERFTPIAKVPPKITEEESSAEQDG